MVESSVLSFQSNDGMEVVARKWIQEDLPRPKALVQIAHGMAEHIMRYNHLAKELVAQGFFVYGNDHRGHGETARKSNRHGYFADEDGFEKAVEDMQTLTSIMEKEYPGVPIILFGHSMGSFLSRRYIQLYGNELAGVILSGTGGDPGFMGKIGRMIASWEKKKKGSQSPSPLLNKLTFGNFNKAFRPNRTEFDWLTRNEKEVDQYIEDPLCGGIFSTGFFFDFLNGLETVHNPKHLHAVPTELPIYLISGSNDPVGGKNGKGVIESYQSFQKAGMENVTYKLYENARHELLNEVNKDEVIRDVIDWIHQHI
ncbi:alpha/beta hydrolase [Bacillus carboniphilus]|uniref:Alpha/beta hydrolase n=1 Tax=Bacillus carboniphilus TaxID=86663 RepID=A0ABP3GFN6_9BACI